MARHRPQSKPAREKAPIPAAQPHALPPVHAAHLAAICAALAILTFTAFSGVFSNGFVTLDDPIYVTENAHVQAGLAKASTVWAFTATDGGNWHPVTWLSHMLDVQFFGLDAGKHHLSSLLLHILNVHLLFLILVRLTEALWPSAFAACLFAVHPLHVESVAWIAERRDVLSTLFWLLALAAWLRYLESKKAGRYTLVLALYALGLMAKPMLVTFPFTLLLLDFWPLRRLRLPLRENSAALKGLLVEKLPLFVLSAIFCVVALIAQQSAGAVQTLEDISFPGRIANAVLAYVSYLGKTLWPASLAIFYPHPHVGLFTWAVAGAAVLLAGLTALALRLAKPAPFLAFGWLWYLGTLVPVIGLVQVGAQAMADRYSYVSLIGPFIALAWGLAWLAKENRLGLYATAAAAAVAVASLLPVTRAQVRLWTDDRTLYEHALAVTSENFLAHYNLGLFLQKQGKVDEAVAHYEEAIRIAPRDVDSYNNLGAALQKKGRLEDAVRCYKTALGIRPDSAQAFTNLGLALTILNRLPEAVDCLQRAVQLNPDSADAQAGLAVALDRENRPREALEHFQEALRIQPDSAQAWNESGLILAKLGRMPEAIDSLQNAVRIRPDFAEAHYNLGVALTREGHPREAADHFQEALRIRANFDQARVNLQAVQENLRQHR